MNAAIESNELILFVEKSEVSEQQKSTLLESFQTFFEQTEEWKAKAKELVITSVDQKSEMKMAREARLALKNIRVSTEHKRKELKEESLRTGQTIDAIAKIITNQITPIEQHLEQQEKFVEIQENKRKDELRDSRMEALAPYGIDASFYDLRNMPDSTFAELLNNSRLAYEAKQEEARKEEEARIAREKAEIEERERMRVENERLKAEVEQREKEIAAEREKAEAERKAQEEAARVEREAAQAKADAERAESERIIKARCAQLTTMGLRFDFRDSYVLEDVNVHQTEISIMSDAEWNGMIEKITPIVKQRLQAQEDKRKADREAEIAQAVEADKIRREQEENARLEAELAKGDAAKFSDLIADLKALTTKYTFKSKKHNAAYAQVIELINKTIAHANSKVA